MGNFTGKPELLYGNNSACRKPEENQHKVYCNILHTIGNTPLVKLNRIPSENGLECEFYAKCEFLNPGGSYKDRVAYAMVQDAESHGTMSDGSRAVVPTSGNTGIGMALVTAVKDYDCTIVSPDKNSDEKMNTMRLLGADVVVTSSTAHEGDPGHFMAVAERARAAAPHAVTIDQYSNPANPMAHYEYVAEEILTALGHVDMVVVGTGTGGTISGVGRKLKERIPNCIVVAVDPKGSQLFSDGDYVPFKVEGIGGDFLPDVLDKSIVDRVEHPDDCESFNMARNIIRKEGLLCGGSSGAVMCGALWAARALGLGRGKRVVVMMADGIRNYMTKFVTDQWMEAHLFKDPPVRNKLTWWDHPVSCLQINKSVPIVSGKSLCLEVFEAMGDSNSVALVVDLDGFYQGAVSKDSLRGLLTNPKTEERGPLTEQVSDYLIRDCYRLVTNVGNPVIGLLSRMLDITPFVVIVEETGADKENVSKCIHAVPKGIVTADIVLNYIIANQQLR